MFKHTLNKLNIKKTLSKLKYRLYFNLNGRIFYIKKNLYLLKGLFMADCGSVWSLYKIMVFYKLDIENLKAYPK